MKCLAIIIGIMVLVCLLMAAIILGVMSIASFMNDSFHWGEKDGR